MYHDVLIAYRENDVTVYVYDQPVERVIGIFEIDAFIYENVFGLHEILVSRCRISHDVLNRLLEYAGERPVTEDEMLEL